MDRHLSPLSDARREHLGDRQDESQEAKDAADTGKRYRTRGQRDRDRILYSSAFQRLAYTTQVTAPESGHIFHNRLIHSLKVAQVGRRNAERLKDLVRRRQISGAAGKLVKALDPDCVEAACLAHDLGHPPFGHVAEEVLDERAKAIAPDGFEGNPQSFRILTRLAVRAESPPGLNLTRQTLDGTLKYPWRRRRDDPKRSRKWGHYDDDEAAFKWVREYSQGQERSLEAELMDWADDLTYAVHDVDDFYRAGMVPLDRLAAPQGVELRRFTELLQTIRDAKPEAFPDYEIDDLAGAVQKIVGLYGPTEPYEHRIDRRAEMREFGSKLITRYLEAFTLSDTTDGRVLLRIDPELHREVTALKLLTVAYVIRSPALAVVQHGQQRVIADLYEWYFKATGEHGDKRLLPPGCQERMAGNPNEAVRSRAVIDLIAGLTEASAIQLHQRLRGGWSAPTLDATATMG